jgi:hypothetical protein
MWTTSGRGRDTRALRTPASSSRPSTSWPQCLPGGGRTVGTPPRRLVAIRLRAEASEDPIPSRRYGAAFREVDIISLGGAGAEMGRQRPSRRPRACERVSWQPSGGEALEGRVQVLSLSRCEVRRSLFEQVGVAAKGGAGRLGDPRSSAAGSRGRDGRRSVDLAVTHGHVADPADAQHQPAGHCSVEQGRDDCRRSRHPTLHER